MTDSLKSCVELNGRFLAEVLNPLKRMFIGKDEIIDLMGVCLIAGENLFLLGPPGTAKSALVLELGRRLEGRTFEYLLTRFTEPSELFGPFDIRKLRDGELVTNTDGMLPEAALVFLDELLNANSAILNSLLMVLNERILRRGRETRALPTLIVIGASNHLPEEDALAALFDRFMMRVTCDNVPTDRLGEVLQAGWRLDLRLDNSPATFSVDEVRTLHRMLPDVDLSTVRHDLIDLVIRLRHAGIAISDRRAVKLQRLVAASALNCGRITAQCSDLWVFRHIWDTLEQQEVLAAIVQESIRKAPAVPADHPRARTNEEPNPEELARDLDDLRERLGKSESETGTDRTALQDRLGLLAGRCQWVKNETQRSALQQRLDVLWSQLGTKP